MNAERGHLARTGGTPALRIVKIQAGSLYPYRQLDA